MELNIEQIKELIPHRYPFLLVDRITECVPGERAVGLKCVSANEPFFQGHFPEFAVMPGVLIVEALAQVGAVAILSVPENKGKLALFGAIKNARFKKQVRPGDQLELRCTAAWGLAAQKRWWMAKWLARQSLPLRWPTMIRLVKTEKFCYTGNNGREE